MAETVGERAADFVAALVGSWPFVLWQTACLAIWVTANTVPGLHRWAWDPEPYILLNLMLSFQAAYTGPIVMISQNRQAARDRKLLLFVADVVARMEDNDRHMLAQNRALRLLLERQEEKP